MEKKTSEVAFKKQSLIDYSIEIYGNQIGWINKNFLNGKNSGSYYFGIRINAIDIHPKLFLFDSKRTLSEAKKIVRNFMKENI